jgi:hypothetical protein
MLRTGLSHTLQSSCFARSNEKRDGDSTLVVAPAQVPPALHELGDWRAVVNYTATGDRRRRKLDKLHSSSLSPSFEDAVNPDLRFICPYLDAIQDADSVRNVEKIVPLATTSACFIRSLKLPG